MKTSHLKLTISLLYLFVGIANAQITNYIASPFNSQNITGYRGPFLVFSDEAPSVRYQQVYDNSDFTRFTSGPQLITEVSFSTGAGFLDVMLTSVQINLSTTQREPDGLSSSFSQNVGVDDTLVYSGPLRLYSRGFSTYGVHIPLQQPFVYNPAGGNLLLEVRNFQTITRVPVSQFALADDAGDSSSAAVALDVNSDAALRGSGALLTEFTVTQVPEPSSVVLIAVGVGCLLLVNWWHRNRGRAA